MKRHHLINLLLVFISTTLTIYFVEIYFYYNRLPYTSNYLPIEAEKAGVPFDTRSKFEVYEDMKSQGIDVIPIIYPSVFRNDSPSSRELLPMAGRSNINTLFCNESGEYVSYVSDKYGFNNPPGSWNLNEVDLLIIGDSFAHGTCVPQGDDIAGLMRLKGFTALNIAMGATGPLFQLSCLTEYGPLKRPDVVLWLYYEENDQYDLESEKKCLPLMHYLDDGYTQNLSKRQKEIDSLFDEKVNEEVQRLKQGGIEKKKTQYMNIIVSILKLRYLRARFSNIILGASHHLYKSPEISPLYHRILKTARERTEAWGGRLVFIYLPSWGRYALNKQDDLSFHHRGQVLDIARKKGLDVWDFTEVMNQHPDPLSLFPFRVKAHYNKDGYKLISELISERL